MPIHTPEGGLKRLKPTRSSRAKPNLMDSRNLLCRIDPRSFHTQVALTIQPRPESGGEDSRRVMLLRPLSTETVAEELRPSLPREADAKWIPAGPPKPPEAPRPEKRPFPANLRAGDPSNLRRVRWSHRSKRFVFRRERA